MMDFFVFTYELIQVFFFLWKKTGREAGPHRRRIAPSWLKTSFVERNSTLRDKWREQRTLPSNPTSSMAFLPFKAPVSIIAILACFLAGNSSGGIKTNTYCIYWPCSFFHTTINGVVDSWRKMKLEGGMCHRWVSFTIDKIPVWRCFLIPFLCSVLRCRLARSNYWTKNKIIVLATASK